MNKSFTPYFLIFFGLLGNKILAQNVGIGTASPDASAKLHIEDSNRGILIPQVSLINVTNGTSPVNTPATSLLVFNTNAAVTGGSGAGFYYWDGTQWLALQKGGEAWLLTGNVGTTAGINFIGTTDAVDWVIKTNNLERMRVMAAGNVGISTAAPNANTIVHIDDTKAVLADGGALGSGGALNLGASVRMLWYPKKAAFMAGRVTGTQWDDANVGNYSALFGYNNTASGAYNLIAGENNSITATGTHNMMGGINNGARGDYNMIGGQNNQVHASASGDVSNNIINGLDNEYGTYGIINGFNNESTNSNATINGSINVVSGSNGIAFGGRNTVSGNYSTAIGNRNTVSGDYGIVSGGEIAAVGNTIVGDYGFAHGRSINMTSTGAHNVGLGNIVTISGTGTHNFASGWVLTESGTNNFTHGFLNTSSGSFSTNLGGSSDQHRKL